jgi:DNA-binding transcriptional MerR regulator/methylmalonyl-CoA mutase cobalamin-binding subunit
MNTSELLANISAVERDTGLSKDTLRVWERRYKFPRPLRDANGDRAYPSDRVEKLKLIKRLLDRGHRPRKIISLNDEELAKLGTQVTATEAPPQDIEVLLRHIKAHQLQELRRHLSQRLARQGLQTFILETIAPLTKAVGDAWMHGYIAVFEEHLYTEVTRNLLRNAITAMQSEGNAPRVLITSLPGEQHGLGLLMLEAVLTVENASCISLGTETPLADITQAALAHKADIVALSFSAAYPATKAGDALKELRVPLPDSIDLCAGGGAIARIRQQIDGVQLVAGLESMCELVKCWRTERASDC